MVYVSLAATRGRICYLIAIILPQDSHFRQDLPSDILFSFHSYDFKSIRLHSNSSIRLELKTMCNEDRGLVEGFNWYRKRGVE